MNVKTVLSFTAFTLTLSFAVAQSSPPMTAAVPPELVASYESLADTILGAKATERNLVLSILATTFNHARVTYAQAAAKIEAGSDASADLEKLADLVSQLGNEGDAAVAAVRKRLLEGGHHHNAAGEQQGLYDPGFVIVTRSAKQVFLGAAREIGRLGSSPNLSSLRAQWERVEAEYARTVQ